MAHLPGTVVAEPSAYYIDFYDNKALVNIDWTKEPTHNELDNFTRYEGKQREGKNARIWLYERLVLRQFGELKESISRKG